ncbi:MAG: hypothetical protein CXX71_02040 [Methanobacteriota archaeon]|nr:MAG: hypothetical protein CXX71_02040 [Euryarchaeota archaeon]
MISLQFNITNNANINDDVSFMLTWTGAWNALWNSSQLPCTTPLDLTMSPGALEWPHFDIHVPMIINGSPLAGVRHAFTLSATSSIDGVSVNYSFTLELDAVHGLAIDSEYARLNLDPGEKLRHPVTMRNIGNAPMGLAARVVPLDADGEMLLGFSPELSFQYDGWMVGVFEVYRLNGGGGNGLQPNESGTVQIEVQAPAQTSGGIHIGVIGWSGGAPLDSKMLDFNVDIELRRGGLLEMETDCWEDVLPNRTCTTEISVTNTGNFADSFEIVVESNPWLRTYLSRSVLVLQEGERQDSVILTLQVDGMVAAFSHGTATVTLRLQDGAELESQQVEMRVGAYVDWDLNAVEASTDSRDNVSVAFTLRNLGNGDDGLQVSMHVDVNSVYGLIPPPGATYGSSESAPRYFEVQNVPPGVNFTFRAWMLLPTDMEANGTANMRVEMQSVLAPDIVFINETQSEFLAEQYRPENVEEDSAWQRFEIVASIIWNTFSGLAITIIVCLVGAFGLHRAFSYRKQKDEEWLAKQPKVEDSEKPEDWLGKFTKGASDTGQAVVGAVVEAPKVAARVFTDLFTSKSKKRAEERERPSEDLLDAANVVLEHHEGERELERLDDMADGLLDRGDKHPANIALPPSEQVAGRTVRKPKRVPATKRKTASKGKATTAVAVGIETPDTEPEDSQAASTPVRKDDDDDLDLDL